MLSTRYSVTASAVVLAAIMQFTAPLHAGTNAPPSIGVKRLPLSTASVTLEHTARGCRITINATNNGTRDVVIDLAESESKIQNGFFSKWRGESAWTVNTGGANESKVVELDQGCIHLRQYRFLMRSGGNERIVEYPSRNEWEGDEQFSLGNVWRHFNR
jgi:hypothetical protein